MLTAAGVLDVIAFICFVMNWLASITVLILADVAVTYG